uniref:Uncharacterized protein n=1 Tax=Anguilla anguilla TaxID=7936 RepID=A0A0E9RFE2_ANGAN
MPPQLFQLRTITDCPITV